MWKLFTYQTCAVHPSYTQIHGYLGSVLPSWSWYPLAFPRQKCHCPPSRVEQCQDLPMKKTPSFESKSHPNLREKWRQLINWILRLLIQCILKQVKKIASELNHVVLKGEKHFSVDFMGPPSWRYKFTFSLIYTVVKSLPHIRWNLSIIHLIRVVYFNCGGCLDVNRPKTLIKVRSCGINWVLRVQRAPITVDHPDLLTSPSTVEAKDRCLECHPIKIGQITGWPHAPVSLMWLGTLAQTHQNLSKTKHTNARSYQQYKHCPEPRNDTYTRDYRLQKTETRL